MKQRNLAVRISGWLRDLWIALGISLLLFGLLEGAYLAQRAIRASISGSDSQRSAQEPGHPYAGQEWYQDFLRAQESAREKYDPWRGYWAYSTTSRYLNVDSAGYRRTVQAVKPESAGRLVYLLGASAMWGFTSRDSLTIPSLVAAGLQTAGFRDVAVVNLAQPGYTVSHELATLIHELDRGRSPAIAVFYDGINDIRTTHLHQEPGHAFFEQRFGHLFEVEAQRGFFGSLVSPAPRSKLFQRLVLALGLSNQWALPPREDGACARLGEYYRNVRRTADGLGDAWGFDVVFAQQPNHASTRKPLTAFEKSFIGPGWIVDYTRECSSAIDSAMDGAGQNYLSYGSLFDADTATVFIDRFGHVTEEANRRIADALVREIAVRLERRSAGAGGVMMPLSPTVPIPRQP